jgi:hypothetical protein
MAAGVRKAELQAFLAALQRCMARAASTSGSPPGVAGGSTLEEEGNPGRRVGQTGFAGVTKHK